jgi:hypothetical protein
LLLGRKKKLCGVANHSPPGSLQERWPKRAHKLSQYSATGCICMPPQCHHWQKATLYHNGSILVTQNTWHKHNMTSCRII